MLKVKSPLSLLKLVNYQYIGIGISILHNTGNRIFKNTYLAYIIFE